MNEVNFDKTETVLVTGASGFVASHIIRQLLLEGYNVRGTVRDLSDVNKVDEVNKLVSSSSQKLELFEANLKDEKSWLKPIRDCDFVIHVASVIPKSAHDDPKEIIDVSVNGTISILRACCQEGSQVKRVILTSSIVTISGDNLIDGKIYTEKDHPDINKQFLYSKSKILSEKAAFDFLKEHNNPFELSIINPGFILGPVLYNTKTDSLDLIKKLMLKEFPFVMIPDIYIPCCDVRDVALAHIRAMKLPGTVSERHIITNSYESPSIKQWVEILDKHFGNDFCIPTKTCPNFLIRIYSLFDENTNEKSVNLSKRTFFDNKRMTDVLLIHPIDLKKSLIDTVNSMIEKNIIQKPKKKKLYFF